MGFPTYGYMFRLLKTSKNGLQAEAIGPASPGKYIKQSGFLGYYEITGKKTSSYWLGLSHLQPGREAGQRVKARVTARDRTREIHHLGHFLFLQGKLSEFLVKGERLGGI